MGLPASTRTEQIEREAECETGTAGREGNTDYFQRCSLATQEEKMLLLALLSGICLSALDSINTATGLGCAEGIFLPVHGIAYRVREGRLPNRFGPPSLLMFTDTRLRCYK